MVAFPRPFPCPQVPFADSSKIPLTVTFPEGSRLSQTSNTLPVEISFCSSKPFSFTANLDFFDEENTKFSIPVTGCTDNCIFTNLSYTFAKRVKGYELAAEGPNKAIMLIDKV